MTVVKAQGIIKRAAAERRRRKEEERMLLAWMLKAQMEVSRLYTLLVGMAIMRLR